MSRLDGRVSGGCDLKYSEQRALRVEAERTDTDIALSCLELSCNCGGMTYTITATKSPARKVSNVITELLWLADLSPSQSIGGF